MYMDVCMQCWMLNAQVFFMKSFDLTTHTGYHSHPPTHSFFVYSSIIITGNLIPSPASKTNLFDESLTFFFILNKKQFF